MRSEKSLLVLLRRLWEHISTRRRLQFGGVLVVMVLASFAEIFTIGTVLPFLGVLTGPERVFKYPAAQPLIHYFALTEPRQLLLPITLLFGVAVILAGGMRLLLLWAQTRLSYSTGADLSIDMYRRTLYQPYSVHIARNSSEVINGISGKSGVIIGSVVLPALTILSGTITMGAVLVALLALDPVIALSACGGFALIYLGIVRFTHHRLLHNSQKIAKESDQIIKALQEGLGGIRDVLIDGSQAAYCRIYQRADWASRQAQVSNAFIGQSPRYLTESLGMLLIAGLAYVLASQADGISRAIPVLGALALAAQRLLPVLQQAYQAWSLIRGSHASLDDALELLDQPLPEHLNHGPAKPLPFSRKIRLNHVSFRYSADADWVLKDLDLEIPRGARVGFIGITGSGKSTLLDIVMGLLAPISGRLEIDDTPVDALNNRAWQAHIAHVPQAIFLSDSSVAENIAFGVPKEQIDQGRVRQAAAQAQIAATIEGWPDGYDTVVGERGVRLSGGQRQRIGIARALYKQADVIIFDEATSALDGETELAVMSAIESLGPHLTILIIAHRLNTLQGCELIVELGNGAIKRLHTNDELQAVH